MDTRARKRPHFEVRTCSWLGRGQRSNVRIFLTSSSSKLLHFNHPIRVHAQSMSPAPAESRQMLWIELPCRRYEVSAASCHSVPG